MEAWQNVPTSGGLLYMPSKWSKLRFIREIVFTLFILKLDDKVTSQVRDYSQTEFCLCCSPLPTAHQSLWQLCVQLAHLRRPPSPLIPCSCPQLAAQPLPDLPPGVQDQSSYVWKDGRYSWLTKPAYVKYTLQLFTYKPLVLPANIPQAGWKCRALTVCVPYYRIKQLSAR